MQTFHLSYRPSASEWFCWTCMTDCCCNGMFLFDQLADVMYLLVLGHSTCCSKYIVNVVYITSFDLVFRVKPDFCVLFWSFLMAYFKQMKDGTHAHDGVEAKSLQGITLCHCKHNDGLLFHSCHIRNLHLLHIHWSAGHSMLWMQVINLTHLQCDNQPIRINKLLILI